MTSSFRAVSPAWSAGEGVGERVFRPGHVAVLGSEEGHELAVAFARRAGGGRVSSRVGVRRRRYLPSIHTFQSLRRQNLQLCETDGERRLRGFQSCNRDRRIQSFQALAATFPSDSIRAPRRWRLAAAVAPNVVLPRTAADDFALTLKPERPNLQPIMSSGFHKGTVSHFSTLSIRIIGLRALAKLFIQAAGPDSRQAASGMSGAPTLAPRSPPTETVDRTSFTSPRSGAPQSRQCRRRDSARPRRSPRRGRAPRSDSSRRAAPRPRRRGRSTPTACRS
jgi:hypothetical protein